MDRFLDVVVHRVPWFDLITFGVLALPLLVLGAFLYVSLKSAARRGREGRSRPDSR